MDHADIEHRFAFHPAAAGAEHTAEAHEAIRRAGAAFAHTIAAIVPGGREEALAVTQVENAMMWANAGIARAGGPKPGWTPHGARPEPVAHHPV